MCLETEVVTDEIAIVHCSEKLEASLENKYTSITQDEQICQLQEVQDIEIYVGDIKPLRH